VAQGGFVCGWIDAAMAHASLSLLPEMTPMSLEMKVTYFAPARPGLVIAEGWIERAGRATCFAEGRLLDPSGAVLAKASSTIRLIPRAAVEDAARRAVGG
jgi:acyl-coenzyme A thioesterase PaaI-like protein